MLRHASLGLLALGAAALTLEKPEEEKGRDYYYGTPYRISSDPKFPMFPNLTHCPPGSVTATGHNDGFGAVWTAMLTVYNYARTHDIPFCTYSWDAHLDHNGNGGQLFKFIGGRQYGPKPKGKAMNINQKCNQQLSPQVREEVRHFYWHAEDPKPELVYYEGQSPSALKVAWHVRHGDILDLCEKSCAWRLLTDEQIKHGMKALKQKYGGKLQRINIFTDGKLKEFTDVLAFCGKMGLECKIHAGDSEDIKVDFHHMVAADVLVMARSTLSGMAGVINSKDVLDAHALAEEPSSLVAVTGAKALSDDEKAKHLLRVQMNKAQFEGKGVAQLIGPLGRICPDDPDGGPIIKPH